MTKHLPPTSPPSRPPDADAVGSLARAFDALTRTPISTEAAVVEVVTTWAHLIDHDYYENSLWAYLHVDQGWFECLESHMPLQMRGDHQDLFFHMMEMYADLIDCEDDEADKEWVRSFDNEIWWRDRTTGQITVDVILNLQRPEDLPLALYGYVAQLYQNVLTVRLVAPALSCLSATWRSGAWTFDDNRTDESPEWDSTELCAADYRYPW